MDIESVPIIHWSNFAKIKDLASIKNPVYAWKCEMSCNYFYYVVEGDQPNAFHRLMQRLILGFKWERIK